MSVAVIVQARLGSKRFPRKVLADLNGKTVLQHVMERAGQIGPKVILATPSFELTTLPYVRRYFMGSENDVLDRFLKCAKAYSVETIVRITADCPLLQPDLCRKVIDLYDKGGCSYAAIGWPATFPKGYGCEVFSRFILELAHGMAVDDYDREHVTPWIERHCKSKYLTQSNDESHINYCIDTPQDLERVRKFMTENKTRK